MILHICKAGEDAESIARRYGVSPSKLLEDNGTSPLLLPGRVLAVFPGSRTHTLRGGESPAAIAARYGLTDTQLLRQNPSLAFRRAVPGQVLRVDVPIPEPFAVFGEYSRRDSGVLPLFRAALCPVGRLGSGRLPAPPACPCLCIAVADTTGVAPEAGWHLLRQAGYRGVLPRGEDVCGYAGARRMGEWVLSDTDSPYADGVLGKSDAPAFRALPCLPSGGTLSDGISEQSLTDKEVQNLLTRWRAPLTRDGDFAVAEKLLHTGGESRRLTLHFADLQTQKAALDRWVRDGIRGCVVRENALSVPALLLLGESGRNA